MLLPQSPGGCSLLCGLQAGFTCGHHTLCACCACPPNLEKGRPELFTWVFARLKHLKLPSYLHFSTLLPRSPPVPSTNREWWSQEIEGPHFLLSLVLPLPCTGRVARWLHSCADSSLPSLQPALASSPSGVPLTFPNHLWDSNRIIQ